MHSYAHCTGIPTSVLCLQFVVRTRPHKRFIRKGNDLLLNATITLVDALVGFEKKVCLICLNRPWQAIRNVHCLCSILPANFECLC